MPGVSVERRPATTCLLTNDRGCDLKRSDVDYNNEGSATQEEYFYYNTTCFRVLFFGLDLSGRSRIFVGDGGQP